MGQSTSNQALIKPQRERKISQHINCNKRAITANFNAENCGIKTLYRSKEQNYIWDSGCGMECKSKVEMIIPWISSDITSAARAHSWMRCIDPCVDGGRAVFARTTYRADGGRKCAAHT